MFSVSTFNFPALQADLLQQELFQHIREILPSNLSLADKIAELLKVSPDGAYRRIRGEKSLSFQELQKLSSHFRISLDSMLKIDSRSSLFYGNWIKADTFNFREYLGGLLDQTEKLSLAERKMIYYEARDFFPVHYLYFPELAAFKYFYWIKTILSHPDYAAMSFEDHDLSEVMDELSPKIINAYNAIPTVELWSDEIVNATLHQITTYEKAGAFKDKETPARLYAQLETMLKHINDQAEHGQKFAPGQEPEAENPKFKLYFNEAYLGHNTLLTESDGLETVYINHGVLNMTMTNDREFCANTRNYFEHMIQRSVLINGVDEARRQRFFAGMNERIKDAKGKK
jgi:hypothetical protein